MPDGIDIDDMINEMPVERLMVATARALRARGIEYEWTEEGTLEIDADPDELAEDVMFLDALDTEVKKMCADDLLYGLERKGLLVSHADEDGEVAWTLADGVRV